MSFGDAIGECFFNYANFRDRAGRAEYWWWVLFSSVILLLAYGLDYFIFPEWNVSPFYLVFSVSAFLPGLSVSVRRLHVTNRSGWWVLLPIGAAVLYVAGLIAALSKNPRNPFEGVGLVYVGLPMVLLIATSILLIVFMALPSNPGNNRFGPNRYAGG